MISMCSSTAGTTLRATVRTAGSTKDVARWAGDNALEVGGRFIRGTLPGERLGEGAGRTAKALDELARGRDSVERRCHRRDVTVRHEIAGLTIPNRFANARRVGCDDRGRACGGLEIRDAPALFWRGKDQRPRAAQQGELLILRYTPKKPHTVAEVKRTRQRFEPGAVVACPGDLEGRLTVLHRREGANDVMHSLVFF